MRITAFNHRSRQTRRLFQHHIRISVLLKAGKLHKLMGKAKFYSEDEPRRIYWDISSDGTFHSEDEPRRNHFLPRPSPPALPRKMEMKLSIKMSFPKREGMSQHLCGACRQMLSTTRDIPGPSTRDWKLTKSWKLYRYILVKLNLM